MDDLYSFMNVTENSEATITRVLGPIKIPATEGELQGRTIAKKHEPALFGTATLDAINEGRAVYELSNGAFLAGPNVPRIALEALEEGRAVFQDEEGKVQPLAARGKVYRMSEEEYTRFNSIYQNSIRALVEQQRAAQEKAEEKLLKGRVSPNPVISQSPTESLTNARTFTKGSKISPTAKAFGSVASIIAMRLKIREQHIDKDVREKRRNDVDTEKRIVRENIEERRDDKIRKRREIA